MKKMKNRLTSLIIICSFITSLVFPACPAKAADEPLFPTAWNNLDSYLIRSSDLVAVDNGFMRVFLDGEKINIEYYNKDFQIQSKKSIEMEMIMWGGFFAGSDAYYLVEGQPNVEEDDTAEVIRVIKYDKDWNRIAAANITGNPDRFGGEVRLPFDYGCVEMTEHNGTLYIATGHEGYVDPIYGQGHQGFLMITVDETTMTGKIVDSDFSHSFAQYIAGNGSNLYVLEQCEMARQTTLTKYDYDIENQKKTTISVLDYGGAHTSAWSIPCFASVDGIALSSDNVLCLGTSIDQSQYDNVTQDTAHNIYLTITPMSDFSEESTKLIWLTNYTGDGKSFLGTKITKINDDRFMISWEEFGTDQAAKDGNDTLSTSIFHYLFIDGEGNNLSEEFAAPAMDFENKAFTASAPASNCQPIVQDNEVIYYASNANMVNFYRINVETSIFSKRSYQTAGEHVTWSLRDGVLTMSGSGAISFDTRDNFRHPRSFTSSGFVHTADEDAWAPVRDNVTKIVIEEGITSIPERAFQHYDKLTEIEIKPGLESIGALAFYGSIALEKITIPASVTTIGEDIIWTGLSWVSDDSHVIRGSIYAPLGSYAIEYAKANNIYYYATDPNTGAQVGTGWGSDYWPGTGDGSSTNNGTGTDTNKDEEDDYELKDITEGKVQGIKDAYAYNGKAHTPKVKITLHGETLKEGRDYTVSYRNNINTGMATVEIEGINHYAGAFMLYHFYIVPKKAVLSKLTSPKAGQISVKWKKDPQASGYLLQCADNKQFSWVERTFTITNKSKVSKKITKLTRNQKHYVRVCAYKKVNGKKHYGAWSKVKTVKCKG